MLALVFFTALEDGPGAEKTDPGDDPLEHPAHGIGLGPGQARHQHEQGRAHGHQHMGANPGGLALVLAFKAQNAPQQGRHQQPQGDLGQLPGIADIGEFVLQGQPDFLPPGVHAIAPHPSRLLSDGPRPPAKGAAITTTAGTACRRRGPRAGCQPHGRLRWPASSCTSLRPHPPTSAQPPLIAVVEPWPAPAP